MYAERASSSRSSGASGCSRCARPSASKASRQSAAGVGSATLLESALGVHQTIFDHLDASVRRAQLDWRFSNRPPP